MAEIILASCDPVYHELYAESFQKSAQNDTYIHVVEDNPWDDKSYYACARYLILPEMIEEHEGVFIADIDAVFLKPIPFPTTKIGLIKTSPKPHRSEWEQKGMHVMAGMFYCSDVDIAIKIRDKILGLPKKWFVDQIAIHEVIKNETSRTYFQKPPNDFVVMPRGEGKNSREFKKLINTVIKNHS